MNFFDALHTSSSALSAQRVRMNIISSNLANINTTRTQQGAPYRRKDVVFAAQPNSSFQSMLRSQIARNLSGVRVAGIVSDPSPLQLKYDPQHPDANEEGYVSMPNINLMEEMVNMISATRSYEASVAAINATKGMALKALEIGR
ncbi:MAG: flagellar basal body rod protein FlgC [Thermodesulfobacteriota bacterium]|nr:flagellar basal body rod protein FlgC [Thermodesulfobacteriota bacterium]